MYKRVAQVGNILWKEKEKEKGNITEKREQLVIQTSAPASFYQKKPKTFAGFQGSSSSLNDGYKEEARPVKPLLDRDGKEWKYFCRRCKKNHPENDCERNLVECNF